MEKTKLGISVAMFGAALYLMGLVSALPLVLMAGYVLLYEQNEWLKKTAVKAVMIVVVISAISAGIGLISNASSLLYDIADLFNGHINLSWMSRTVSVCRNILSVIQTIILLLLGFRAMSAGNMQIGAVDKTIDKHM